MYNSIQHDIPETITYCFITKDIMSQSIFNTEVIPHCTYSTGCNIRSNKTVNPSLLLLVVSYVSEGITLQWFVVKK